MITQQAENILTVMLTNLSLKKKKSHLRAKFFNFPRQLLSSSLRQFFHTIVFLKITTFPCTGFISAGDFIFNFADRIETIRRQPPGFHPALVSALVITPCFPFNFNGYNIPVPMNYSNSFYPSEKKKKPLT